MSPRLFSTFISGPNCVGVPPNHIPKKEILHRGTFRGHKAARCHSVTWDEPPRDSSFNSFKSPSYTYFFKMFFSPVMWSEASNHVDHMKAT